MLVLTNGVFDCLHPGHIRLLKFARSLCTRPQDELAVALNSDDSACRIKGPGHPIFTLEDRVEMLLSTRYVNRVYAFSEDTPKELIRVVKPDVLVKGPEYAGTTVPGADLVHAVEFAPGSKQHSTSDVIRRCQRVPICDVVISGDVTPLSAYHIAFCSNGDGTYKPVLYRHGKRCISAYEISIHHFEPADEHGRSA